MAYARVSTERQADVGSSLEVQEAKIRAYCGALDLDLVRIEIDAGESAASLRRPALQRALLSLKRGEADALIVTRLDRLTRSVRDLGTLVENYFTKRAALISMTENIDTRSAGGQLVLNVLASVAQWERQIIAERTSVALQYKRAKHEYTGGKHLPYGYARDGDGDGLVHVDAEKAVIVEARALRAAGLSLRAIAATLDSRGLRSRRSRPFGASQIARMLEAA